MVSQEGLSSNKAPLFDGSNYDFWSITMEEYLSSLGFDIWMLVVKGHTIFATSPMDQDGKRSYESKSK